MAESKFLRKRAAEKRQVATGAAGVFPWYERLDSFRRGRGTVLNIKPSSH
jgi:hypothetical protein